MPEINFYTWVVIVSGLIGFLLLLFIVWSLIIFYKETGDLIKDLRKEEDRDESQIMEFD